MPVNSQLNDEIRILTLFNLDTSLEGIKAHKSADPGGVFQASCHY